MNKKGIDLGESKGKFDTVYMSLKDYENIQKKLKVLEIIKEKKVDIKDLYKVLSFYLSHPDCELKEYIYYNALKTVEKRLTEKEYDLLKEILL